LNEKGRETVLPAHGSSFDRLTMTAHHDHFGILSLSVILSLSKDAKIGCHTGGASRKGAQSCPALPYRGATAGCDKTRRNSLSSIPPNQRMKKNSSMR
jgi:hypothetical protein